MGYSFLRNVPTDARNRPAWLNGGRPSLALNMNRRPRFVVDFGGSPANRFGSFAPSNRCVGDAPGNIPTYMFGPRLPLRHTRVTPFVQALFEGTHATEVKLGCSGIGCSPPSENAFAMTAGRVALYRRIALHLKRSKTCSPIRAETKGKDLFDTSSKETLQQALKTRRGAIEEAGALVTLDPCRPSWRTRCN